MVYYSFGHGSERFENYEAYEKAYRAFCEEHKDLPPAVIFIQWAKQCGCRTRNPHADTRRFVRPGDPKVLKQRRPKP